MSRLAIPQESPLLPTGRLSPAWQLFFQRLRDDSNGGTITSISVVPANGISGSITNPTTTPAITLALGAITPTSVASTGAVTGSNLSGTNTGNETAATIGTLVNSLTAKTTPVDADQIGLMDSAASNILAKLSWANVKATLKAYFDTLYPSGSGTSSGTNTGDQFTTETASTLIGRGSAGGVGAAQEITVGVGLSMAATTLAVAPQYQRRFLLMGG